MAGKLSQPGCHTNTGIGAKSGRSLVKLEVILPDNNNQREIPRMRGQVSGKVEKKGKRNGKKILGRTSSILQFGSKRVIPAFKSETQRVEVALSLFRKLRAARASFPQAAAQVLALMKERHSHLLVNSSRRNGAGPVPGVQVGRCFGFRAELCLVGLHRRTMSGIDWTDVDSNDGNRISIALAIVVSGGYEDNVDEGETLIYTGEGGQDARRRQCADQKLEGGNMALRNSYFLQNPVRVIRGTDVNSSSETLYSYDGLYKVANWREDVGRSRFKVFKFTLVREAGQPALNWQFPVYSRRNRAIRGF
ncbi:unnamed protein product [Calypogeia fissa]